jgi:hypothetical protein
VHIPTQSDNFMLFSFTKSLEILKSYLLLLFSLHVCRTRKLSSYQYHCNQSLRQSVLKKYSFSTSDISAIRLQIVLSDSSNFIYMLSILWCMSLLCKYVRRSQQFYTCSK